jgi:hypothetical protein
MRWRRRKYKGRFGLGTPGLQRRFCVPGPWDVRFGRANNVTLVPNDDYASMKHALLFHGGITRSLRISSTNDTWSTRR